MAIYRVQRKVFAEVPLGNQYQNAQTQPGPQQQQQVPQDQADDLPSARELQAENMKMQRQIMMNQRLQQQLAQQERNNMFKRRIQEQKIEQVKDNRESREQIQTKRLENEAEKGGGRQSLVKQRTTALKPIPMR
jgi:hypothetical protein